jgi:hypothetical protein
VIPDSLLYIFGDAGIECVVTASDDIYRPHEFQKKIKYALYI